LPKLQKKARFKSIILLNLNIRDHNLEVISTMLRSKRYIRVITSLFMLGFCAAAVPMQQEQASILTPAKLQRLLQAETQYALAMNNFSYDTPAQQAAAPQSSASLKTGMAEIDELLQFGQDQQALPTFTKERERMRDQNTILLSHPKIPIALYKGLSRNYQSKSLLV